MRSSAIGQEEEQSYPKRNEGQPYAARLISMSFLAMARCIYLVQLRALTLK